MTTMRFRQVFVALMLMVAVLGLAGVARGTNPFTFTSPTGSTVWQAGTTVTIQWTGGSPYPTVYLSLIDVPNWVVAEVITTSTANTGSYEWTIPCTVPGGTYEVYIQDTSGPTEWKYSDDFTILGCKDPTDPKEQPDLAIEKKPDGELVAGQNAIYQIVVSNVGTAPAPGPIVVTDSVGAGLTFLSAAGSGWTCSPSTGPIPGPTAVTCTHPGPLPAGGSLPPIILAVAVAEGVDEVQNCASVMMTDATGAALDDPDPLNNRSCVTTTVVQPKPGKICGVKFHDVNGNGVQDPGEPGMPGWTIEIRDTNGNVVATITTGPQGRYCIENLKPGTYVVSEVPQSGWTQTFPAPPGTHTITLGSGQTVSPVDFGNRKAQKPADCCLTFKFPGGKADNFFIADGATAEPATPPPGAAQAYFDETVVNKRFDHRISLPQGNCIKSATLQVRVKPLPEISYNDTIALKAGSGVWSAYFGAGNPGTVLLPNYWITSNYGSGYTFNLNLGSLPGGGNLLAALNSARHLDIGVQDDTSVDFVRLTVEFCECDQVKGETSVTLTVGDTTRVVDRWGELIYEVMDVAPVERDGVMFATADAFAEPLRIDVKETVEIAAKRKPNAAFPRRVLLQCDWCPGAWSIELEAGNPEARVFTQSIKGKAEVKRVNLAQDVDGNGGLDRTPFTVICDTCSVPVQVMVPVAWVAETFGLAVDITTNAEGSQARIIIADEGVPPPCKKKDKGRCIEWWD